jgi:FRG domain
MESSTGEEEAENEPSTRVTVKRSSMEKKAAAGAVASFRDLHTRLSRYQGTDWIFRGHADISWELIPKAGRDPYTGHEAALFESWKRRAVEHVATNFTSDWDWLAIAQHHKLATRLLDWTTNPLNAAYFAVKEPAVGPAVIHAARFEEPFKKSAETLFKQPLDCDSVAIFRPRGVVPRIVRQGGLFTVHGPPERSLESLTRDRIVILKQIVIAESYRSKLLVELARYGINSASLFPDLDGLSLYLNWSVESGEFLD